MSETTQGKKYMIALDQGTTSSRTVLIDHDGADLTEHFDRAAELLQLLVGVHSDIPIRSPQLGQRLLYDLHACTPFKKARALSIFSAAARTMPGSIS